MSADAAGPGAVPAGGVPAAEPVRRHAREPREPGGRPSVTTGTPRPEGGGPSAGGDAPAPARQWPILLVITGVVLGLLITAAGSFRPGTLVIGGSLLVGAVLRWGLARVGMLAVRSRFTDVITYGVLGLAIVLLALMVQPDPLIRIPFLEDIIHFSVR
ncbi:DUF3017 domain-containing protein [Actinacidiphila sp. ITFR-21]|uniref:DUF3017 domain-containing protein n=1 Tax=Actinacidiphila sp. ITFR-21 TaxID=3075199 RepID=UPI00288B5E43|nr:DUF3017 domain-containing protein [Streptomyces sp. ITFR-21]WNI17371.1 DUF3017 domain-containing protein [Streptomyces sp. ITFR-21]